MKLKTTEVTVTEVINADTFRVEPFWQSTGQERGDTIKINGFTPPQPGQKGYEEAMTGLENIIRGKHIELRNPTTATSGKLICDVIVDGKDITTLLNR